MLGRQKAGVFLSYARKDGEQFASKLRARLTQCAPDISINQDRNLLEGGVGWWKQITDAIDSVDFLVLVMTPHAMASETVRKEWRYARQQGACVYPVKGVPDSELRFSDLPKWMSRVHFFDLEKEWESFLAHLRKGCDTPRVPFMAPDVPPRFVPRPKKFGELKNLLLGAAGEDPLASRTALVGAGGFGKTTLVTVLCHDEEIIETFDEGILWVTLGQQPDVVKAATTLYAGLTDERPAFVSVEDAAIKMAEKLGDRTCLLVIDNVWDFNHLVPFVRGGAHCVRLITTRYPGVIPGARTIDLGEMNDSEADAMLRTGLSLNSEQIRALSVRLGNFPLALEAARSVIQTRINARDSAAGALRYLETALTRMGPSALPIERAFLASFELLNGDNQRRLTELSIFPPSIAIPFSAAGALWKLDDFETERVATEIADSSLVRINFQSGSMGLHDVLRSWLERRISNSSEVHGRLVDSWPNWYELPSEYAWRWLTWHLAQAGRKTDLERILWDPMFVQAKLHATDVNGLIAAYEYLKPSRETELMQGALRLSAHVIARKPEEFASQIIGRLLPYEGIETIAAFNKAVSEGVRRAWVKPLRPALHAPGMGLIRTLASHSDSVRGVAVTADGRRAVSASKDKTLKVWDLVSGIELGTLAGHSEAVWGVALTADGRTAISASEDKTVKVWNLASGEEVGTLRGHSDSVWAVAATADGRRTVSASSDNTLKIWDLGSGEEVRTLRGHSDDVRAVAVTADGRRAVSASKDKTLKVWDLVSGQAIRTLIGHSDGVCGVALTADGRRAISASEDKMLKVWDVESGNELCTLKGHSRRVNGVALSGDGRRAVSASVDRKLKVWDLANGHELRTLEGHSGRVYGVALVGDGRIAVSASDDNTLKVWDMESGRALRTTEGHTSWVNGLALSGDGALAVSASDDNTLKVWDMKSWSPLRSLRGHGGSVNGVALSGDGALAVSASVDKTLKVWDVESGSELLTLEGHGGEVDGVALSADGRRAVSASEDKTLKLWDVQCGRKLRTLEGHSGRVNGVVLSVDGRWAVSASDDKTLKVWDVEAGYVVSTLQGHTDRVHGVSLSGDGRRAVSASDDNTLKVWDLETGRALRTLSGHSRWVRGVALYGDGRRAVSASGDTTVKLWDVESGAVIANFTCDSAALSCALAGPDEILAGDAAGRLYFLRLETKRAR